MGHGGLVFAIHNAIGIEVGIVKSAARFVLAWILFSPQETTVNSINV